MDQSNVWRSARWRELVALSLQLEGFENAAPVSPSFRKPSAALSEGPANTVPRPGVENVPGWFLGVHSDIHDRMGTRLDAAQQGAQLTGAPHAAAVLYRKGRPTSEAFVVMTLAQFATVAQAARPGQGTP